MAEAPSSPRTSLIKPNSVQDVGARRTRRGSSGSQWNGRASLQLNGGHSCFEMLLFHPNGLDAGPDARRCGSRREGSGTAHAQHPIAAGLHESVNSIAVTVLGPPENRRKLRFPPERGEPGIARQEAEGIISAFHGALQRDERALGFPCFCEQAGQV